MGYIGILVWFVTTVISVHAEAYNPDLGAKVDTLISAIKPYDRLNFSVRQDKKFGNILYDALSGLNIEYCCIHLQVAINVILA